MTGMLELSARGIDPANIDHIELQLPDMHAGILSFAQPTNQSEALFSLPYCASMVLLSGDLTITDSAAGETFTAGIPYPLGAPQNLGVRNAGREI